MGVRIYKPPQCGYTVEGGHLKTDGTVIKKVSGTMMAGILGISPWSSPFQVACDLLGLAREDISGKPAVKNGNIQEGRIIRYAGEQYSDKGLFLAAKEVYEKRAGDHDSWVSDFDSDIFAGHVDGIVIAPNGQDYILEIKTSSNLDSWINGVPKYYYWQVALYNRFLTHRDHAYVVLGIMDQQAYRDPMSWMPNANTVVMYEMPIDSDEVEQGMAQVRDWYGKYIANGITPDYDPSNPGDVEMYSHLVGLTDDVSSVQSLVDQLGQTEQAIAEYENNKQVLYDQRDLLKVKIKEYLDCHSVSSLDSTTGEYYATLRETHRVRISAQKLIEAGLDPAEYSEDSISKTFSVKKKTH